MANNIKRMIKEKGIVLEKILKKATDGFTGSDGRAVAPQPERYILKCISSEEFNEVDGFEQGTILEYKVDKNTFDKAKYQTSVLVKYEVSNYGCKADSLELIQK